MERAIMESKVDSCDTFASAVQGYAEAGSFDSAIAVVRPIRFLYCKQGKYMPVTMKDSAL
jgi:hypothetical protein